jgi:hypothetical protein
MTTLQVVEGLIPTPLNKLCTLQMLGGYALAGQNHQFDTIPRLLLLLPCQIEAIYHPFHFYLVVMVFSF